MFCVNKNIKVEVVSLIKSFGIGEEKYICSSGPLTEEIIRDEEEIDVNSKNKFFPEFEWTEAEEGADYDFLVLSNFVVIRQPAWKAFPTMLRIK